MPSTRRRLLAAAGTSLVAVAGCTTTDRRRPQPTGGVVLPGFPPGGFASESAPAAGMVVLGALYGLVTAVSPGGAGAPSGRFGGGRWARVGSGIALLGIAAWLVATNVPA